MSRLAGYARVSTEKQAERFSIDAQKRILMDYAQREGHSIELFIDAGISGETIPARPEFQRLLREVTAGRFDVVLAVDADRYSRASDLSDWQTIKRTFRKAGIRWGTPSQWMHESEFVTDVLSAVSAEEKRKILARTMRGKMESIRKGKYPAANSPFGYRTENGLLLIHEPEAVVVRRMFELALDHTYRSLARRLTDEGVQTPMTMRGDERGGKEWRVATVARILTNPLYTGRATWGKRGRMGNDLIEVAVPWLIDQGMFSEVQKALGRNAKFARRNDRDTYLLKGLIYCSCGRPMYGVRRRANRYYRCSGMPKHECSLPHVRADEAEQAVTDRVLELLEHPEVAASLPDQFTRRDEVMIRLGTIATELGRLPESRHNLIARHAEFIIGASELREHLASLEAKKTRLERERESLADIAAQAKSEELTARRLAQLMSKHADYQRHVLKNIRQFATHAATLGGDPAQQWRALYEDWIEILRTVIRKVNTKADGTLDVEAVVLIQPVAEATVTEKSLAWSSRRKSPTKSLRN
jgi:site-specific DNA recombinase